VEGITMLIRSTPATLSLPRFTFRRLALAPVLLSVALVALSACAPGASTAAGAGTALGIATTSPATPKADTSLCNLISPQEFFAVVKGPVGSVQAALGTASGFQEVSCTYKPPTLPGAGGALTYLFTNDGAAYFAKVQQGDQSVYNSETVVTGLGDAAFWGTQTGSPDAFELNMRKGNVVVNILMDGSAPDGSVYLAGAEQIAKEVAAHI
jgi:hypothetical protein